MYSFKQIKKGIDNPQLIKSELIRQKQRIDALRRFDYAITGAYYNGNVGDRAIATSFKQELQQRNRTVGVFHSKVKGTNSGVHVLGGGGVLRDCRVATDGGQPDILKKRLDWVSNSNKGAMVGIGVPGFKTDRAKKIVKQKLPKVDLITVRDLWSREKLEQFCDNKIHVTACPAVLLEDPACESTGKTGVNFRPWPNYSGEVMEYHFDYEPGMDVEAAKEEYIENAKKICSEVKDPVFIPFNAEDEVFAREHLDVDVLPYKFSVEETLKRVSSVSRMVAMRYHSLVFSVITDTPVLVLAYQPKVSALAERLEVHSHKPNESNIPVEFQSISNKADLTQKAQKNFELLEAI